MAKALTNNSVMQGNANIAVSSSSTAADPSLAKRVQASSQSAVQSNGKAKLAAQPIPAAANSSSGPAMTSPTASPTPTASTPPLPSLAAVSASPAVAPAAVAEPVQPLPKQASPARPTAPTSADAAAAVVANIIPAVAGCTPAVAGQSAVSHDLGHASVVAEASTILPAQPSVPVTGSDAAATATASSILAAPMLTDHASAADAAPAAGDATLPEDLPTVRTASGVVMPWLDLSTIISEREPWAAPLVTSQESSLAQQSATAVEAGTESAVAGGDTAVAGAESAMLAVVEASTAVAGMPSAMAETWVAVVELMAAMALSIAPFADSDTAVMHSGVTVAEPLATTGEPQAAVAKPAPAVVKPAAAVAAVAGSLSDDCRVAPTEHSQAVPFFSSDATGDQAETTDSSSTQRLATALPVGLLAPAVANNRSPGQPVKILTRQNRPPHLHWPQPQLQTMAQTHVEVESDMRHSRDAAKEQTLEQLAAEMCQNISPLDLAREVLRLEAEVSAEQRALNVVSNQAVTEMLRGHRLAEEKKVAKNKNTSLVAKAKKSKQSRGERVSSLFLPHRIACIEANGVCVMQKNRRGDSHCNRADALQKHFCIGDAW